MNYVFLGSYFPKDKVEEITGKSIGPIANANNLWQWNFYSWSRKFETKIV